MRRVALLSAQCLLIETAAESAESADPYAGASIRDVSPELQIALIAGGFTVLGALGGQLATYAQFRRQNDRRWETDVRALALRLYKSAGEVAIDNVLSDGQVQMFNDYEELSLLAKPPIVAAAGHLVVAAQQSQAHCQESRYPSERDMRPYLQAQLDFKNAAREALGVRALPQNMAIP